ncbi:MAG: pyruvate ferredoxin oxidoreductase [Candidatus Rokubacteria bacterium]|nr:pyruvate ferredoxin oxidoreductase [Candidatus Rokubacteria bacterium]
MTAQAALGHRPTRMLLTGDHAVAYGALRAQPHVIPVYPITPQTPVLEKLVELAEAGELRGDLMTVESEHSAMAACIAASLAGARVFTATASQGLALMHEMLHYAAGARAPVVMVNVNRTLASPWGFWADQTDSLAQRDTGWIQLYCESAQEALDTVLHAFRVAEAVLLPAMVVIEAVYVSHTLEPVEVPEPALVARFLPPFTPTLRLDPARPRGVGGTATPAQWRGNRLAMTAAMDRALEEVETAGRLWGGLTGRASAAAEAYRAADAEVLLVTAGSIAGTAREAVDRLREEGIPAGLVRLRLFRPFPAGEVTARLRGARRIAVLDRNCSVGSGGIFAQEVRAALQVALDGPPPVLSYLLGLGGINVSVERVIQVGRDALRRPLPCPGPILEEAL